MGEMNKDMQKSQAAAAVLLFAGWVDVAIGIAALLWGDRLLPSAAPVVLGQTVGTIVGLVFLLVAAPSCFALYYLRRGGPANVGSAVRGPVEKL